MRSFFLHYITLSHVFSEFYVVLIFISLSSFFKIKGQNSQSVRFCYDVYRFILFFMRSLSFQHANQASSTSCWKFCRINFFDDCRRVRARFDENEWTLKTFKYKTLYISDWKFYMWNVFHISESSDERWSFTASSDTWIYEKSPNL